MPRSRFESAPYTVTKISGLSEFTHCRFTKYLYHEHVFQAAYTVMIVVGLPMDHVRNKADDCDSLKRLIQQTARLSAAYRFISSIRRCRANWVVLPRGSSRPNLLPRAPVKLCVAQQKHEQPIQRIGLLDRGVATATTVAVNAALWKWRWSSWTRHIMASTASSFVIPRGDSSRVLFLSGIVKCWVQRTNLIESVLQFKPFSDWMDICLC